MKFFSAWWERLSSRDFQVPNYSRLESRSHIYKKTSASLKYT
jgi:hypothetical protein